MSTIDALLASKALRCGAKLQGVPPGRPVTYAWNAVGRGHIVGSTTGETCTVQIDDYGYVDLRVVATVLGVDLIDGFEFPCSRFRSSSSPNSCASFAVSKIDSGGGPFRRAIPQFQ